MRHLCLAVMLVPAIANAQEPSDKSGSSEEAELAKKLSNPISSLISVPFQSNADYGMGASEDGAQYEVRSSR